MIELGFLVEDKVTGFIGVADSRATFLYGCNRYHVQPRVNSEGVIPEGQMIDEPQLHLVPDADRCMEPSAEPPQLVTLGKEVHDPILGQKGTATGRAVYLNGCSRIFVEPKRAIVTGEATAWWVDEQQLVVKKKTVHKPKSGSKRPGGPARSCSKY